VGLADYVADRILANLGDRAHKPLRVLDPACGDGVLLASMAKALRLAGHRDFELWGVESEQDAADRARTRLETQGETSATVLVGDFLAMATGFHGQRELYGPTSASPSSLEGFDVVIANPPYVRTQVLGASIARGLAERFGLSGRVDLCHAFIVGVTAALRVGGVVGIILSNKFLSTLAGASVRRCLSANFDIRELVDLGDTKLFEAAVLPAVVVASRRPVAAARGSTSPVFIKVYTREKGSAIAHLNAGPGTSVYDALRQGRPGPFVTPEGAYDLSAGRLSIPNDVSGVWELATGDEAEWVRVIRAAATGTFGDFAKVRVGIKTTADSVFIRTDWDQLPDSLRPEDDLLHPILGHGDSCRWAMPKGKPLRKKVLYPHEGRDGVRRPVDLDHYPRAKAYLESHRTRLAARQYVVNSGRQWFEIWVPQDPEGWAAPKVVFPDISDGPRFSLDAAERIVDGNCYWLTLLPGIPDDVLLLLLGLANSAPMARFHDLCFNNRLYAGRRRYITQYVSKYPCPDPASPPARRLVGVVRGLVRDSSTGLDTENLAQAEMEIDTLVCEAFHVPRVGGNP
jgi:adenine-specific DNA-methyltransferase